MVAPSYVWLADDDGHDWFEAVDDAHAMSVARPLCLGHFDAAHVHAMTFAIFQVGHEDEEPVGTFELAAANVAPPR